MHVNSATLSHGLSVKKILVLHTAPGQDDLQIMIYLYKQQLSTLLSDIWESMKHKEMHVV